MWIFYGDFESKSETLNSDNVKISIFDFFLNLKIITSIIQRMNSVFLQIANKIFLEKIKIEIVN